MQAVLTQIFHRGLFPALFCVFTLMSVTAIAAPAAKPVVVAEASLRELAPVNWYTGTVISREQARLAAEVSGRMLWVAEVGGEIEKGELLRVSMIPC